MFKRKPIVAAIALAIGHSARADLTSGLVAYYPFNGNANDASGNANNGTVYGATLTADRFGNANSAYSFDGSSNYIEVTDGSQFNFTSTMSLSLWIKPGNSQETYAGIIDKSHGNSNQNGYLWSLTGNRNTQSWPIGTVFLQISGGVDPYIASTHGTQLNNWQHITIIYDFSIQSAKLYVNDVLKTTSELPSPNPNTAAHLYLATDSQMPYYLDGVLDDIRIYNRALTAAEITELYTLPNPNAPKAPTVVTNPATNLGVSAATLNGQVNSNGATAIVSFNYGLTTNYGNTIPAVPSTLYGNAAVTANFTGLNCNTSYHFRCQAVNSVGTGTGSDQIFATSATCPQPSAWFYPADKTVMVGKPFILDLKVNSGGSLLGAYDFSVGFDKTRLQVDTTKCTQGVCAGKDSLASNQIVTDNANGSIRLAGFDASGVGPGNDLQLLQVNFVAKSVPGATPVNLTLNDLADANADSIGNNGSKGSTVTVTNWLCGDADGTGVVNIVDALAVSRYVVGLPPPPTVNLQAADVNGDGRVAITDALLIARYSVGLLVVGSCLGQ